MTDRNEQYRTLPQKAMKLMRITSALSMFFFVTAPAIVACVFLWQSFSALPGILVLGCALMLSVLYVLLTPKIRFKRYKYLIAPDRVEIIEGLFFIKRTIVPIDRIYQIDIKAGPLDNAVGVAKVTLTTAGSFASFRFLEPETAQEIALYLNETVLKKLRVKGADNDV